MDLVKLFCGEKKPENEGFDKVYETSFKGGVSLVYEEEEMPIRVHVRYDVYSEFFINQEKNIAYMIGNIRNREVSIPNLKEAETELKRQLDIIDYQRIFAYSECEDGTIILTGNLGIEQLNNLYGGIMLRIPDELFIEGIILRNVEERNPDKVLRSHKNYVSELEIVSDPKLVDRLVKIYREMLQ